MKLWVWNCIFSHMNACMRDLSFPLDYLSLPEVYPCLLWRVEWILGRMLIGMQNTVFLRTVLWICQWLPLSAWRWQPSASLPASQRVFTHVITSVSDTELDPTTFWLGFKLCHFAKPSEFEIVGMKLHLFPHESMHGRPFLSLILPFIAWSVSMSALKGWMDAWKDAYWPAHYCF